MPTEFRRIVFNNDELQEALVRYPGAEKIVLPPGKLQSVRFDDDSKNRLLVEVYDRAGDHRDAILPTPFVAAALVRFCIAKRIPLPRSAQKAVTVSGDNVALDLRSASKSVVVPTAEATN